LATAFFTGAFLATAFFAAAFLATAFFTGACLAGVFLTAAFFAVTFSVALTIACPRASSMTFLLTPLVHGIPDSSFNLLDSFFALALFVSHAEVPR
jgi:hypothetical protein